MEKELYIEQFTDFTTGVQVGEYFIKFPAKPGKKDIVNHNLPREKQVFRKTTYEVNGKQYFASDFTGDLWKYIPESKKKEIYNTEWERRRHGQWYYIDGKTIFIPGFMYFFLNYVKLDGVNSPQWWDSQWFNFLLTEDSFYHPKVLALLDIKGRRGGGTAIKNACASNVVTGFKNSSCGIMNYNEDQAKKVNFTPIRQSILKLPDFFLPEPYLTARLNGTLNKQKTVSELVFPDVNCNVYISPTKETGFDGTLQRFSIIDECYKWPNTNPMITLEKNVLCAKDGGIKQNVRNPETGEIIMPAALVCFVSSVDEINDDQISVVQNMWDVCSPETATDDWCSTYGARRYFEPTPFGFKGFMDKFGFSDYKKAEDYVNREYENILKNAGYDKAREFKRKNPLTIEDAITPSSQVCSFNFEILERSYRNAVELRIDDPRRPVYCQLDWVEPYKSVVCRQRPDIRQACKEAPFVISGHPDNPNHIDTTSRYIKPLNIGKYIVSLDPVDYNLKSLHAESKKSLPSIVVKRILDMAIDGDKFDNNGNPKDNGFGFETNRTVLTYLFRHPDVKDLWEDIAKVLVYYGAPLAHERSTRSVFDFLDTKNMLKFVLDGKGEIITEKTKDDFGIKTQEQNKRNYFDSTRTYIERYGLAERHLEVIEQLMKVRPETMTRFDLAASRMIGEFIDSTIASKYRNRSKVFNSSAYEGLTF